MASTNRRSLLFNGCALRATRPCKECGARIEMWQTKTLKWLCFDAPVTPGDEKELCTPHHLSCAKAKVKARKAELQQPMDGRLTEPQTQEVVDRQTLWFAKHEQARCVVTLCGGGIRSFAVRDDEDAEQLRTDLITMANAVRTYLLNLKGSAR